MTDLTPGEHEHNEAVVEAAQWLAVQNPPPYPTIPALRNRFGLSAIEACEACKLAQDFRILRRAFG